jgi:hypothetical protein
MNKKALQLGTVACLAAFAAFLFLRKESRTSGGPEAGDVGKDLPARAAVRPKPSLAHLPHLGGTATPPSAVQGPAQAGVPPAPARATDARIPEETLDTLRRAFTPPRFPEDPSVPRERQTLLSNRRLVSPETRSIPKAASGQQSPTPRGTTPFIVQLNTPVSDAARELLTDAGAVVRGFFPNNAVLAEFDPAALAALEGVAQVQAADEFLPADKLQPFLSSLIAAHPAEAEVRVTVQTFAPEDAETAAAAARKAGGEVEETHAGTRWGTVRAVLPLGAVRGLASLGAVQWIEERPPVQRRNDKAAAPSHLNATNAWAVWGLTGKGQVVGHADTGLDTGNPATLHPDFQGRVRALIARARPGDASDLNGHGTHTAGSILGSGAASGGRYRGTAWEAELVHQSVVNASGSFTGLPADLYPFYTQSYTNGARIHSDSWGSSTYGAYDSDCRATDLFAWDHPDHLAVFAAGNDGRDTNGDGRVDPGAVGSPATAKNALAVGAAENDRPAGSGGYSAYTWGFAWPSRYPVNPIKNDYISYSATPAPVYLQGMAAFSSRGPAADGRVKPDVVAPGTDVISTKSSVGGVVWASLSSNSRYCFGGGTSMATPLAAGLAALARQYCVERAGVTNPSAALLKAMLVGGARSLAPGQYGTDSTQEIPFASPNSVEGWGQPDIAQTVHPSGGLMVRLLDRIGPAGGETNTFEVTVTAGGRPLDVALCWMDYPATAGAGVTRVNDLDLLVTTPDGTPLHPNGGAGRDDLNTVETVRVPSAQAGLWRVHVIGASVPYTDGGAAALYVRGAFEAPPVAVHAPVPDQIASATPYRVEFHVQSPAPLTNGEARVWWMTENGDQRSEVRGQGAVSGLTSDLRSLASENGWQEAAATWVTDAGYFAEIPSLPPATTVHYYIEVTVGTNTTVLPPDAPGAFFSFYIDNAAELVVEGSPARFGTVTPPYGTNTQIASVPFAASAPATVAVADGVRRACSGWTGTGDIPAAGATNAATFTIDQPSTLTWLWSLEYALTNRYRLADTGQTFGQTVSWHPQGTAASTETALELGFVGSAPYAFCGWSVDGTRWPDAVSTAPNPATGIVMSAPRTAQGDYLPFWRDTDGDGMSDWWELRYFGSTTNAHHAADGDPDGDTWTNLAEFLDNTDPNDPSSVPAPPAIDLAPLAPFQTAHPPWTVAATVTDNMTVEEVYLVWREKGETGWRYTPMEWAGGDTFQAALAPPSHGAKRVDYRVYAADLIGYYLPEYASVSPIHSVIGDYETPWLAVTPQTFEVFELSDAPTNIALSVANLAGPDLTWTARVAAAAAPFAVSNPAWAHSGQNDAWCATTNRTWNGDAVWYCGNPTTRTYLNGCHAMLDTPPFTVGAGGGLLFRQWIRTEYDADAADGHYWDGAVVRVSADGGATFTLIEPASGYPYRITDNPDSPFAADHPCLAGDGGGWETLLLDLSAYAGQSVVVRFEFGSDLYVIDEGWYIAGVAPFSFGGSAPWLVPSGAWGGTLPDTWTAPLAATLDPAAVAYDEEVAAVIRIDGNDPSSAPLIPLTLRRGHRLFLSVDGPGTATADRTFLFRGAKATATLRADPGCYLYSLFLNGVPQPGVYDYSTATKTVTFADVAADQHLSAWFTPKIWSLTVESEYDSCYPAPGTYTFTNGTTVGALALSPVPLSDTVRLECTGWELTGHTPPAGAATLVQFAVTNDATLTWKWTLAFRLTADVGPNGTVAPAGGWYVSGSSAVVTAYPSAYYHFDVWSGDLSGAVLDGPRLSAVMAGPRVVAASFAPNLTVAHGVPEWWLAQHGWTQDFEAAADADADSDGMAAWAEWRAGTDPTDPLSLLAVTAFTPSNITWIGGLIRTQTLQRADSLSGPWVSIHTNLPPTAVTNTLALPGGGASGFFRIAVP